MRNPFWSPGIYRKFNRLTLRANCDLKHLRDVDNSPLSRFLNTKVSSVLLHEYSNVSQMYSNVSLFCLLCRCTIPKYCICIH